MSRAVSSLSQSPEQTSIANPKPSPTSSAKIRDQVSLLMLIDYNVRSSTLECEEVLAELVSVISMDADTLPEVRRVVEMLKCRSQPQDSPGIPEQIFAAIKALKSQCPTPLTIHFPNGSVSQAAYLANEGA